MGDLATGVADAGRILRDAARLLWRHWPMLLSLFLLGEAARQGLLWLALRLGAVNVWPASAVVPLAPLAGMLALVLMLRAVAPSLSRAQLSEGAAQVTEALEVVDERATDTEAGSVSPGGGSTPTETSATDTTTPAVLVSPDPPSRPDPAPESGAAPLADTTPPEPNQGRRHDVRARSAWIRRVVRSERIRESLTFLASVAVPFIAVYQAQGYFAEDRARFVNETYASADRTESLENAAAEFQERTINGQSTIVLLSVLILALIVRRVMDLTGLARRGTGWAFLAVWVEVFWLTWLVSLLTSAQSVVQGWIGGRVFFAWLQDLWAGILSLTGSWGETVAGWLGLVWGDVGALVLTPVAWLAVGAVVFGRMADEIPTASAQSTSRFQRLLRRSSRVRSRVERTPQRVRVWSDRAGRQVEAGVESRFAPLWRALATLRRAGVVPVMVFCLLFVLARQVEVLVAALVRLLVGPLDLEVFIAVSPMLQIPPRAAYTVVLVALLAAAVDRIMRHEATDPDEGPAPTSRTGRDTADVTA